MNNKIKKIDITSEIIDKVEKKKTFEISLMGLYDYEDFDLLKKIYNLENIKNNNVIYIDYDEMSFAVHVVFKNTKTKKDEVLEILNSLHEKIFPIEKNKKIKEKERLRKEDEFNDYLVDIENNIRERISKRLIEEIGKENAFYFLNNKDLPLRLNNNYRVNSNYDNIVRLAERDLDNKKNNKKIEKLEVKINELIKNNKYIKDIKCRLDWKHDYKIELTDEAKEYFEKIIKEETDKYYKENGLSKKTHKKIKNKNKLTN